MIELSKTLRQSIDTEFAKQDDEEWFMLFGSTTHAQDNDDNDDCTDEE